MIQNNNSPEPLYVPKPGKGCGWTMVALVAVFVAGVITLALKNGCGHEKKAAPKKKSAPLGKWTQTSEIKIPGTEAIARTYKVTVSPKMADGLIQMVSSERDQYKKKYLELISRETTKKVKEAALEAAVRSGSSGRSIIVDAEVIYQWLIK